MKQKIQWFVSYGPEIYSLDRAWGPFLESPDN